MNWDWVMQGLTIALTITAYNVGKSLWLQTRARWGGHIYDCPDCGNETYFIQPHARDKFCLWCREIGAPCK